ARLHSESHDSDGITSLQDHQRLLQQNRHKADMPTCLRFVRFWGKADMRCGVAAQRRCAGNEVHIEGSHCFQASSLGTHLKVKSHRWVCERMRSPDHVATLLFGLRA